MQTGENKKKEFIVAYLIGEMRLGQRFTMWPHHMTLLPWFEAPDKETVEQALKESLSGFGDVHTKTTTRDTLGLRKQPVMLVEKTEKLQDLHNKILNVVSQNDWPLKGRWTGELYKPHVTQKMGKDAEGEIVIDKLHIVESQAQGYRQVVGEVVL